MLFNLFQFLAGFRFPKLPAARLERSSFLLAAEIILAIQPVVTKLAIKKAGVEGGNVCPKKNLKQTSELAKYLFPRAKLFSLKVFPACFRIRKRSQGHLISDLRVYQKRKLHFESYGLSIGFHSFGKFLR